MEMFDIIEKETANQMNNEGFKNTVCIVSKITNFTNEYFEVKGLYKTDRGRGKFVCSYDIILKTIFNLEIIP